MSRLYARKSAEANMFMEQRPCACGDIVFERASAVINDAGVLRSRTSGRCRTCGAQRDFVFELPMTQHPLTGTVEFGGRD